MLIFSDHCVPDEISLALRANGHDVVILRDVLPIDTEDPEVIEMATALKRILLTMNGDFSDLTRYAPSDYAGIISLHPNDDPDLTPIFLDRIRSLFMELPRQEQFVGKLFIVEKHRVRVRS